MSFLGSLKIWLFRIRLRLGNETSRQGLESLKNGTSRSHLGLEGCRLGLVSVLRLNVLWTSLQQSQITETSSHNVFTNVTMTITRRQGVSYVPNDSSATSDFTTTAIERHTLNVPDCKISVDKCYLVLLKTCQHLLCHVSTCNCFVTLIYSNPAVAWSYSGLWNRRQQVSRACYKWAAVIAVAAEGKVQLNHKGYWHVLISIYVAICIILSQIN